MKNPAPGTVVNSGITNSKHVFDFYVVSQHVSQGTVSPTHYIVLDWTTDMKPAHIQKIAFRLCHLYFNWTVSYKCQLNHYQ